MSTPIYFYGNISQINFTYFFEELNYFKNKEIKILHLGAYTGHGTRWMLEKSNGHCIDVDTWSDEMIKSDHEAKMYESGDVVFSEVEKIYDEVTEGLNTIKFKGTTKDFFRQNKDTFDFIYIDASHLRDDVAYDLTESFKVLNLGGVIACDDYLWEMHLESELRPYDAIVDFVKLNKQKIDIIVDNYQLWFVKKEM